MRLLLIFTLVAILIGLGCRKDPISSIDEKIEIWPLRVGMEWRGRAYHILNDTLISQYQRDYVIAEDTVIDNETWYYMDTYYHKDTGRVKGHMRDLLTNRADGLYRYHVNYGSIIQYPGHPYLYLKYPAKIGDIYPVAYVDTFLVTSVDEFVSTPFVSAPCVVYQSYVLRGYETLLTVVAPGIGLVRFSSEVHPQFGDERAGWELEELIYKPPSPVK